jgi:hypothetical protein
MAGSFANEHEGNNEADMKNMQQAQSSKQDQDRIRILLIFLQIQGAIYG